MTTPEQLQAGVRVIYHGGYSSVGIVCPTCLWACTYTYPAVITGPHMVGGNVQPGEWDAIITTGSRVTGYKEQFEVVTI